ncbi:MAG TPA: DNA polymerase III subunit delta' [Burkholderiales bacterium]|nr:DNA polymerase III subunit delta' [Burkholderiales bacterium]
MIHSWNQERWAALQRARALPQSLLLAGPRGLGKSEFARTLAKTILCPAHPPGGLACSDCASCRLFDAGSHPDFRLVEPSSGEGSGDNADADAVVTASSRFIRIRQIRELDDFLELSAHLGGHKVVIIRPADRLHPSAANALLKTLEEPPRHTVFVLVSDNPQRLPPTVRSRCFRLTFAVPEKQAALDWLRRAGIKEEETLLAQAGNAPLAAADMADGEYWRSRPALLDALARPQASVGDVLSSISTDEVGPFIAHLHRWCYDLVSFRLTGRLRYNPDHASALAAIASNMNLFRLLDLMRELVSAVRWQEHPLNPRLVIEQLGIRYYRSLASQHP